MSDWHPRSSLATLVFDVGFEYVPEKDIIVSRHKAWQRTVGFTWAYDVACPALQMIIDCEPVYFTYANKHWMIELWKGQYGLETGGEIGVYNRAVSPPSSTTAQTVFDAIRSVVPAFGSVVERASESVEFFRCVGDHEMLEMSFVLKRDGTPLFTRGPEEHWWLTGFKWGEFTRDTTSLTMDAVITCLDADMAKVFTKALGALGYQNLHVQEATVSFTFGRPFTTQPVTRFPETLHQDANKALVDRYNQLKTSLKLQSNDPNLIDRNALPANLAATYDEIAAFLNGLRAIRSVMPTMAAT
jgi:hypothetical protein